MKKEIVNVPGHKQMMGDDGKPLVPLSPAIIAGGFIYVSGQPPLDHATGELVKGDIQVQSRRVLENLRDVLEASGSSLENVVKTTIFCTNADYFNQVNQVYREYFSEDTPARTFVTVAPWPLDFEIEIECVAIK